MDEKQLSPYERVMLKAKEERDAMQIARNEAGKLSHHLLQVSPYRWRVICESSFSRKTALDANNDVENVIKFKFASESLPFNEAVIRLKQFRDR